MPLDYQIDSIQKLVRSRAWGVLTDAETRDHYQRIADDPTFRPTFHMLCDLRGVSELDVAPRHLRDLARLSTFAPQAQRAFVVHADEQFGVARMLQAFCELEGADVAVFRSLAEAERWLGIQVTTP